MLSISCNFDAWPIYNTHNCRLGHTFIHQITSDYVIWVPYHAGWTKRKMKKVWMAIRNGKEVGKDELLVYQVRLISHVE